MIEGKALENPTEALPIVERDYAARIEQIIPIWRLMGII